VKEDVMQEQELKEKEKQLAELVGEGVLDDCFTFVTGDDIAKLERIVEAMKSKPSGTMTTDTRPDRETEVKLIPIELADELRRIVDEAIGLEA
jgi:hypothetical protein